MVGVTLEGGNVRQGFEGWQKLDRARLRGIFRDQVMARGVENIAPCQRGLALGL